PKHLFYSFLFPIYYFARLPIHLSTIINQLFAGVPAAAGVGDGFAVGVLANFLVARLKVAIDHYALDGPADLGRERAVAHDLAHNAGLLGIVLVRVRVVRIDDDGRVFEPHLVVHLDQPHDVLIVVVGLGDAALVDPAAQNRVGELVARGFDLAAGVGIVLGMLRGVNRVEHDRKITAGRVFHAGRDVEAARGLAVVLILNRARADRDVGEKILDIAPVFGVEHLVGRGHPVFLNRTHQHPAHGDEAGCEVGAFLGVGLVGDALVAVAVGARLVGVDAGHKHKPVGDLLLHLRKPADIFEHGVLPVGRARADHDEELVRFAGDDVADGGVLRLLDGPPLLGKRVLRPDIGRGGQFFQIIKAHRVQDLSWAAQRRLVYIPARAGQNG